MVQIGSRRDECQVCFCSFVSFKESNLNISNFEFSALCGRRCCKQCFIWPESDHDLTLSLSFRSLDWCNSDEDCSSRVADVKDSAEENAGDGYVTSYSLAIAWRRNVISLATNWNCLVTAGVSFFVLFCCWVYLTCLLCLCYCLINLSSRLNAVARI